MQFGNWRSLKGYRLEKKSDDTYRLINARFNVAGRLKFAMSAYWRLGLLHTTQAQNEHVRRGFQKSARCCCHLRRSSYRRNSRIHLPPDSISMACFHLLGETQSAWCCGKT
jgi:hypothetical protein